MKKTLKNVLLQPLNPKVYLKFPELDNLPNWEKADRTQWRMWPSSASCIAEDGSTIGSCLRRCYYDWTPQIVTNPACDFVKKCCVMGNYLEEKTREELIKKKLYNYEINKKSNRKFKVNLENITLSSEVDILLKGAKDSVGLEIKSYACSTNKIVDYPKGNHLLQTFLYNYFFTPNPLYFYIFYRPNPLSKWATKDIIHKVEVLRITNNVYPVVNGEVNRNITITGIIDRYEKTKRCVISKTLPKREFCKSSKDCTYCPYKDACWQSTIGKTIT